MKVTFNVTYTSTTPTAATLAEIDLDGVAHPMTAGGTNYGTGVVYSYSETLRPGEHYYRYKFDDGTGAKYLEGYITPWVAPLVAYMGSVTPTTGTTSTQFTFQSTY